jgi:hypothetical protein
MDPGLDDITQVALEIPIDGLLARIVGHDAVVEEHLHAAPGGIL